MTLPMEIYIYTWCCSIPILPMALPMDIYKYGFIVYLYSYGITYGYIYIYGVIVYLYCLWRYLWICIYMVL